jgi:hypothetical protein
MQGDVIQVRKFLRRGSTEKLNPDHCLRLDYQVTDLDVPGILNSDDRPRGFAVVLQKRLPAAAVNVQVVMIANNDVPRVNARADADFPAVRKRVNGFLNGVVVTEAVDAITDGARAAAL